MLFMFYIYIYIYTDMWMWIFAYIKEPHLGSRVQLGRGVATPDSQFQELMLCVYIYIYMYTHIHIVYTYHNFDIQTKSLQHIADGISILKHKKYRELAKHSGCLFQHRSKKTQHVASSLGCLISACALAIHRLLWRGESSLRLNW